MHRPDEGTRMQPVKAGIVCPSGGTISHTVGRLPIKKGSDPPTFDGLVKKGRLPLQHAVSTRVNGMGSVSDAS